MPGNRYYYYDHNACSFVQSKAGTKEITSKGVVVGAAAILLAGVLAWGMDHFIGTPQEMALKAENEALQEQLSSVEDKMSEFSVRLEQLSSADQGLYRTLLEAEPISGDVRKLGVGGSDPYENYNRFGATTALLLHRSSQKLDQLERQINLQSTSFRELTGLARERTAWLAQMPALLPADGPVVSGYGQRMHPILKIEKAHEGVDVLVRTGSPVFATGDGAVQEASQSATYGKHIVINHPETGYKTLYAHLSEIPSHIRPGRKVRRGDKIGLSGNTGRSAGPHVHYEVRDAQNRPLNPVLFIAPSMTPQQYRKLLEQAGQAQIALD